MSNLIEISKEWQRKADRLLKEKELVETLSKFGKVNFSGAYLYGLMMHGDIDISVSRERGFSIGEVFEIFKSLYFAGKFRSYFIGGEWDDPRKGKEFPKGNYVGLKEKVDGERWKFDIWFVSEAEQAIRDDNPKLKSVTNIQRELILECKKYRNQNKLSVTGQEIYDKVIGGEWKSVENFKSIQKLP